MSSGCMKGEFEWYFNWLDQPVEESRPDRFRSLVPNPWSADHIWPAELFYVARNRTQ